MTRVALATCAELPELDEEGHLLLAAIRERGLAAEPAVWDDADVDWSAYDLVVVRSTWDYARRAEEFLAWADDVSRVGRILNPAPVLRWNTDKRYLAELEAAGVPIVPTQFLVPGDGPAHRFQDVEHVVKPAVSAGSLDTLRLAADQTDRSHRHASALLDAGRTVMVQPYLHEVDDAGETALVHIGGAFSHGARKGPLLGRDADLVDGLFAEEEMSSREPSAAERELAAAVLEAIPGHLADDLLYARVDLLPSPEGPRLLELELAEPSLFLEHHPEAADRLADAIVRAVAG